MTDLHVDDEIPTNPALRRALEHWAEHPENPERVMQSLDAQMVELVEELGRLVRLTPDDLVRWFRVEAVTPQRPTYFDGPPPGRNRRARRAWWSVGRRHLQLWEAVNEVHAQLAECQADAVLELVLEEGGVA